MIDSSTIILIAIFLLVAFPVHEFAHAFAAYRLGDGTAKMFGRLTLNPVVAFRPDRRAVLVITACCRRALFGWAKPTPVNPIEPARSAATARRSSRSPGRPRT